MLIDPEFTREPDDVQKILAVVLGHEGKTHIVKLGRGLYLCTHHNFEHEIEGEWELWAEVGEYNSYGVCDSPSDFMGIVGKLLDADLDEYVVAFCELLKSDQPADGGWRWHKWGPYIGTQNPQCEYLYDEPVIERVYTYHFYKARRTARRLT